MGTRLTDEELAARKARAALPNCWLYVVKDNYGIRKADGEIVPCYCLRGVWTPETRSVDTGIYLTEREAWESYRVALDAAKVIRAAAYNKRKLSP